MHPEIARTLAKQINDEAARHADRHRDVSAARERHHHATNTRSNRYRFRWHRGL
jgi:hypothetical protein